MSKTTNMYKDFRKLIRKIKEIKVDVSNPFIIQKGNWSISNYQFWANDKSFFNNEVELLYDFPGATPGSHDRALYQACVSKNGDVNINREGLNKRMDKMLKLYAKNIASIMTH